MQSRIAFYYQLIISLYRKSQKSPERDQSPSLATPFSQSLLNHSSEKHTLLASALKLRLSWTNLHFQNLQHNLAYRSLLSRRFPKHLLHHYLLFRERERPAQQTKHLGSYEIRQKEVIFAPSLVNTAVKRLRMCVKRQGGVLSGCQSQVVFQE